MIERQHRRALRRGRGTGLVPALLLVLAAACGGGEEPALEAGKVILSDPDQVTSKRLAALPEARTEVVGAAWDGRVVAIGGLVGEGSGTALSRVDLYDPATDSWSEGPALPRPLHHAGAAVLQGRLYVAGGFSQLAGGPWLPQSGLWSLGTGETAWREEPAMASPRGALALAATESQLVAIGGVDGTVVLRTTELFTPGSGWAGGPQLRVEREHLAATVANGRVYAIGGRAGSLESNRDTVESFAPGESEWREERKLGTSRGGIGAATARGRACVAGGEEPAPDGGPGTIRTVECLDPVGWVEVASLEVPRHGLAVAGVGTRLHVVGGGPSAGLSVSDVHEVFEFERPPPAAAGAPAGDGGSAAD